MQVLAGGGGPSVKITGAGPWSPGGAATSRRDLLPWVFCPIGDGLKAPHPPRPRTRGRQVTTPTDAGVVTTEPVGEFRGLDADEAVYRHSRAYHAAGFPDLARVCRTTSARRAADPWAVERAPHRRPAGGPSAGRPVRPVDGFPPPARQFARATSGARLAGGADYGYDHRIRRTSYGFRAHPRADRAGVIRDFGVAPARASDEALPPEPAGPPGAIGIGDRGYYPPVPAAGLAEGGVKLPTPYPHRSKEPGPARAARRGAARYRPGTVDGRSADRYRAKRAWARDPWHLTSRITREVPSHAAMVRLARHHGHHALPFDNLELAA